MKEEKNVILNADQKEVVQRRSQKLFFAVKQLDEWVQSDSLTEEMKETLLSLATQHLDDIKKTIGVTGEEPDHLKEMTKSLNKQREDRIAELENIVNNQSSLLAVKQQLKSIGDKLNKWWDNKGFNYIKEITFSENGNIIVNFGFILGNLSIDLSDTPDSDRKALNNKITGFVEQGYLFARNRHGKKKDLIDCENNRNLIINLIKSTFPSSKVTKWENHLYMESGPDQDKFILRSFKVYIYDYKDIENL